MTQKQRLSPGRKFEQVLSGAKDVFLRDGYAGASVDDIARAAGVSKATLYSYFPEKQLMYREILLDEIARLSRQHPIRIDDDTSPPAALPVMARQIGGWLISDPVLRLHRTQIAEANRFPDVSQSYRATLTTLLRDVVRDHLDRWVAEGSLVIEDTAIAADQFIRLAGAGLQDEALLGNAGPLPDEAIGRASISAARVFLAAHRPADGD